MLMPDFRQWTVDDTLVDLTQLPDEVADLIDTYDFGGVILFANNVKETDQTLKLTMDMQAAALRNSAGTAFGDIPLLLTIDQEGGIVYRLGSGTALPGNMACGSTRDTSDARQCGEVIGRELAALKLNVNFAPVFDVNNNPNNPVIGLRSFSSDPELVAELGIPMMQGIQAQQVACAAKHFPGHGDAGTDSHTGLPRIDKSKAELEALEFIPFRAAIDAGVDMVMTAHIQYPQVETTKVPSADPTTGDIELPATLSPVFMTKILRDEFGFTGVSVTDALNMDAIAKNFGYIDAVKRTFKAGVDIALMPVTLRSAADIPKLEQLVSALEGDAELSDERLNTSVTRILTLKRNRGILNYANELGTFEENLARARQQVGSDENRTIEREVAADAICVVKNEGGVLPMRPKAGAHVLLVAAWANERPGMELSMRRLQAEGVLDAGVTFESMDYAESFDDPDAAVSAISEKIAQASHVVVISEIGSAKNLDPDLKTRQQRLRPHPRGARSQRGRRARGGAEYLQALRRRGLSRSRRRRRGVRQQGHGPHRGSGTDRGVRPQRTRRRGGHLRRACGGRQAAGRRVRHETGGRHGADRYESGGLPHRHGPRIRQGVGPRCRHERPGGPDRASGTRHRSEQGALHRDELRGFRAGARRRTERTR